MEYKTIYAFGGIQRHISPFLSQDGDLLDIENLVTEKVGVLRKSFDYSIKGSQLVDGGSIYGGTDFFRNDGTHEHFVAVNDTIGDCEIYKYDSGWVSQEQTLQKNYRVRFAYSPTIDTLFACNYYDATRSYDGSTWSTSTNVTDAPKAKYIASYGNRMYLLNTKVGASEYPSRAYRSELIETSCSWTVGVDNPYLTFDDVITGVGRNGENLFVGCQNSTYVLTLEDEKDLVSTIGCVSHESITEHSNYTFYAGRDGYYCFDGKDTYKISTPIQEYWDNITEANLNSIQASIYKDNIYIYIGDIAAPWDSSETLSHVLLNYNILQNSWSRGRLVDACTSLHTCVEIDGQKMFMGSNDGEVFEMFDDSGQQNGIDFPSSFESTWIFGSGAGTMDDYLEMWGYGERLSGISVSYKTEERDNWTTIGELNEDTDLIKFKIRSYKIKFKFSEVSGKNLYELNKFDVGFMPAYQRYEDRTRE